MLADNLFLLTPPAGFLICALQLLGRTRPAGLVDPNATSRRATRRRSSSFGRWLGAVASAGVEVNALMPSQQVMPSKALGADETNIWPLVSMAPDVPS
jgi:hypothetical protein